jgi:hypothetical protein
MQYANEAGWDRIIRVFGGIALLVLYFAGVVSGTVGVVLAVLGGVFLVTGLAGWCPLYALFRVSTRSKAPVS